MSLQLNKKGKMVQNARYILKNRQNKEYERVKIVNIYILFDLDFC